MKTWRIALLLGAVVFIGLILRVYRLGNNPAGFFCDEAATGYNAYTLAKTGTDEYGKKLPVFFRSFGIWRAPIPFYTTVPFVSVLGLNEFSARLPSALIGTATIAVLFFLVYELTRSRWIALISTLFLSVSPWHIHFSRFAEANIYWPFFLTVSIFVFYMSIRTNKRMHFYGACALFGVTLYTYFPAYLLSPLFLLGLCFLERKQVLHFRKGLIAGSIMFLIVATPLLFGFTTGTTIARLNMTASASKEKTTSEIAFGALRTYRDHFMPEFLFLKGDIGYKTHFITRYSVRGMGELYLFQLPFILCGLWAAAKKFPKLFGVSILWLILYPIGSSVVPFADGGGPFATRSIMGVIPFQMLSAVGFIAIADWLKHKWLKVVFFVIIAVLMFTSVTRYVREYFTVYPMYSSDFWGWQFGPRDVMTYFLSHQQEYDELYLTDTFNSGESFIKFYDPKNTCQTKCRIGTFNQLDASKRQLFALSPQNMEELEKQSIHMTILHIVSYPNTQPAFYIGTLQR